MFFKVQQIYWLSLVAIFHHSVILTPNLDGDALYQFGTFPFD
jgi:hypothetical protein